RNPRRRTWAVRPLCPCHLKRNDDQIWNRLIAMATDDDPQVRSTVPCGLCDGTPRSHEQEVIAALERMQHDTDVGVRRRVRKVPTQYRRTGTVNVLSSRAGWRFPRAWRWPSRSSCNVWSTSACGAAHVSWCPTTPPPAWIWRRSS